MGTGLGYAVLRGETRDPCTRTSVSPRERLVPPEAAPSDVGVGLLSQVPAIQPPRSASHFFQRPGVSLLTHRSVPAAKGRFGSFLP